MLASTIQFSHTTPQPPHPCTHAHKQETPGSQGNNTRAAPETQQHANTPTLVSCLQPTRTHITMRHSHKALTTAHAGARPPGQFFLIFTVAAKGPSCCLHSSAAHVVRPRESQMRGRVPSLCTPREVFSSGRNARFGILNGSPSLGHLGHGNQGTPGSFQK